jgi:hypothetical protein
MTHVLTIARLECVTAARLKWVRLLTAAFALLAGAAAYSVGAANELSGADGFARTTMALIPVALLLIPLAAWVLGVCGQSAEPGASHSSSDSPWVERQCSSGGGSGRWPR